MNLNLPLDLDLPSKLLNLAHGSPFTKGATDAVGGGPGGLSLGILDGPLGMLSGDEDDARLGPIKKLIANPQDINESGSPQSSLWTMDLATKRLNAKWKNSNGGMSSLLLSVKS